MVQFNKINIDEEAHEEEEPPSIEGYISKINRELILSSEGAEYEVENVILQESKKNNLPTPVNQSEIDDVLDYDSLIFQEGIDNLVSGQDYDLNEKLEDDSYLWPTNSTQNPNTNLWWTNSTQDLDTYTLITFQFDTTVDAGNYYLCPITHDDDDGSTATTGIASKWFLIIQTMRAVQREIKEIHSSYHNSCS